MIVLYCILGSVLLLCAVYLFVLLRPASGNKTVPAVLQTDYAHRGLWDDTVPENSLPAFAKAVSAGFGIELDVQLSRDGVVMVFHDDDLFRMTGKDAKLSSLSFAELRELRLAGTDEVIPTFAEVLAVINGKVPLLVELKGESADTAVCPPTDALLAAYGGPYCIESFNPLLVGWYKKNRPDVYRGLLYTDVVREKKKVTFLALLLNAAALNVAARPQFIAYDERVKKVLPVALCTRFYHAGRFTWTVRDQASLDTAHADGACPIFERFIPR